MQIDGICIEEEPGLHAYLKYGLILVQLNDPQLLSIHLPDPTAHTSFNFILPWRKILLVLPPGRDQICNQVPLFTVTVYPRFSDGQEATTTYSHLKKQPPSLSWFCQQAADWAPTHGFVQTPQHKHSISGFRKHIWLSKCWKALKI